MSGTKKLELSTISDSSYENLFNVKSRLLKNMVVDFHVPLTPKVHRFEGGNNSAMGGFCDGG
ncbi:MAG: hypothetical protein SCALA702_19680 [Melioribacteraceae bacterium]|nr:MAG: hypothetical protein SCALA702_19680 [Melioribacteraceae bacterium]